MNWNSKSISEVNKERIWKEIISSENRDLKVFDRYRSSSAALSRGCAVASPVSERERKFLDRQTVLYRSICQQAFPSIRNTKNCSSSHPYHAIEERVQKANVCSKAKDVAVVAAPEEGELNSGVWSGKIPEIVSRPQTAALLTTTSGDIGSNLAPLVKHKLQPFHYGVKKSEFSRFYIK